MAALPQSRIIDPDTGYFCGTCPECSTFFSMDQARCECGYKQPLSLVMMCGELTWHRAEALIDQFREYEGLRLMRPYRGKNPEGLANISHVRYLYLTSYKGFSFSLMKDFSRLNYFELDYTSISDLAGVENLPALKVLNLIECRKLNDIGALILVPELISLRINLCNKVTDYSPLSSLTKLKSLGIEANRLPDLLFLQEMRSLRNLWLPVERLDDKTVPDLRRLTELRILGVPKKRWSAPLVEAVKHELPECEIRYR
ncbi:Internalin-A precursor [Gimesia panareensis]|uniref:Internalin-A n=1 Tax=Gimesia panareensis TaxID=2527978 RepID=A0A518FH16_9PLAN|nr:leucine-rich repeat domain-containing protein [Gimesia panareensis]QDV15600.1 Internalin-A precursor [Gimesia panareensis]